VRAPSSEQPVPLKLPRARAAALFNSVADAAAAAGVTPDRAISGARAEQRADCAALASEGESSSFDPERSRRSRGGERHTRQGDQRCTRRAASGLRRSSFRERARAASIESVADAAAVASVTPDRAISGVRAEQRAACTGFRGREQQLQSRARPTQPRRRASHPTGRSAVHAPSSERPVPLKLPRESKSSFDRERTDAAEAASVTSDRAISGARAEQRAACAAQASEGESSSFDREHSRHNRGGERHTRQGDQRCTSRAARSLCRSSFRERAKAASIESVADTAEAASVTPDRAISGARAEQRADCAAQASEREPEQLRSRA